MASIIVQRGKRAAEYPMVKDKVLLLDRVYRSRRTAQNIRDDAEAGKLLLNRSSVK
jgi:hypothetical protein